MKIFKLQYEEVSISKSGVAKLLKKWSEVEYARSSRCKGYVIFIVMMDTTDKCRWYPIADYRYQSVDERYSTVDWRYL